MIGSIHLVEFDVATVVAGLAVFGFIAVFVYLLSVKRLLRLERSQSERLNLDRQLQCQQQEFDYKNKLQSLELEMSQSLAVKEAKIEELKNLVQQYLKKINRLEAVELNYTELKARFDEQMRSGKSQEELLGQIKNRLLQEFELGAAKLYEEKQKSFAQVGKQNIEQVILPFKEQIKDFYQKIDHVYGDESRQRNLLLGQIVELQKQTARVSDDANSLVDALKGSNKVQGDWGEVILERLLEESGLEKDREYVVQSSYTDGQGRRLRPDIVIQLPEGKQIIVDSKVSLVHYERYSSVDNEDDKVKYLKAHCDSIRQHVNDLSGKRYTYLEGITTLDFVFLFIPIEGAYLTALQSSPSIFKYAYDKNVIVVSPSNLMVVLRTVESIWRYEKQNLNAEQIAQSAGKLYDQFMLVLESLEAVGLHIGRTADAYEQAIKRMSEGRGNVLRRVEELKKMGAKTARSMPGVMHERSSLEE